MQSTILLTEREVAQCLRLGANTLAEWRIRGEEPRFIKIGARIRYQALCALYLARRRALTPSLARVVASLAFSEVAR